MRSVGFITIGCKLNQFETEQMREAAEAQGHIVYDPSQKADVYIINTCTVTSKSDYRSRQAIRRAIRMNRRATIIVTGCYAQLSADEIASIKGVDFIVGNAKKTRIGDYIDLGKQDTPLVDLSGDPCDSLDRGRYIQRFGNYTRAFVKIQDGCDNNCTYCAVPLARGRSRSKMPYEVQTEVEGLVEAGYKEIVLTGVHVGSYGKHLEEGYNLASLIRRLANIPGLSRIRLSSIEPTDFTDELLDVICDLPNKVCPHVHIPLQSGDDRVLRDMGRTYTAQLYARLIEKIHARLPLCGIGTDVMVGFPGENDKAFENTYHLMRHLPVTYLHVFSFSPRPNTPAAEMPQQVDAATKKSRSNILRQLSKAKSQQFKKRLGNELLEVLTLSQTDGHYRIGLAGNYVRVMVEQPIEPNEVILVKAMTAFKDGMLAQQMK